MDDVERSFRIAILIVSSLGVALWVLDQVVRIRHSEIPAGRLLMACGLLILLVSIAYGQLEQLLNFSSIWRLPMVLIGTCWVSIGLTTNIFTRRRSQRLRAKELAERPAQYPSETGLP